MTAHASPSRQSTMRHGDQPSGRRLVGAAIVGSLGVIAFSVAVGASVAASRAGLAAESAAGARTLVGWVPAIVGIGGAHLLVAAAMVSSRDGMRMGGAVASGIVAVAAATGSAMVAAGVDPFGAAAAGRPAGGGVGILALAAVLYGAAALAVGAGSGDA